MYAGMNVWDTELRPQKEVRGWVLAAIANLGSIHTPVALFEFTELDGLLQQRCLTSLTAGRVWSVCAPCRPAVRSRGRSTRAVDIAGAVFMHAPACLLCVRRDRHAEEADLMALMTAWAVLSAPGSTGSAQSTGISSGVMTRRTPILAAVGPCPQRVLVNAGPNGRRGAARAWPRTNAEQGADAQAEAPADGSRAAEKAVDSGRRQTRQPPMNCAVTADRSLWHALPPPMHPRPRRCSYRVCLRSDAPNPSPCLGLGRSNLVRARTHELFVCHDWGRVPVGTALQSARTPRRARPRRFEAHARHAQPAPRAMEGAQRCHYVLEPGVLSAWDEAGPEIVLGPVAVQVRAQGMPRAAPRPAPLRRLPPQRERGGTGHQPVYLLDQPQPALAALEAADEQHGRSAFRARESEDGVVFDPHAVTAGMPVRTLNPRSTTPQPLAALAALGLFASGAAPKGSVFSHIGGTRAAGRSETVTQVSVRPSLRFAPLWFVVSPGGPR